MLVYLPLVTDYVFNILLNRRGMTSEHELHKNHICCFLGVECFSSYSLAIRLAPFP